MVAEEDAKTEEAAAQGDSTEEIVPEAEPERWTASWKVKDEYKINAGLHVLQSSGRARDYFGVEVLN